MYLNFFSLRSFLLRRLAAFFLLRCSSLEPVAHQRRPFGVGLGLLLGVDGLVEVVVLVTDAAHVACHRVPRELQ